MLTTRELCALLEACRLVKMDPYVMSPVNPFDMTGARAKEIQQVLLKRYPSIAESLYRKKRSASVAEEFVKRGYEAVLVQFLSGEKRKSMLELDQEGQEHWGL